MRSKVILNSVLLIGLLALALLKYIDAPGEAYGGEAFQRALITAASARALNGVISVAQGTDVALEPGGVGVNLGVGQILDPVNDLVERFSAVMLVAATSLGVQNILLDVSAWWGVTALLVLSALPVLLALWQPGIWSPAWQRFFVRFLVLNFCLRFAVPVFVIISNLAFNTFLEAEQSKALAALDATTVQVETLNEEVDTDTEDATLLDRLSTAIGDSLAAINVTERIGAFKAAMSGAADHLINLVIIFVLQTVLLPLIFLRLLLSGFRWLISSTSHKKSALN